MPSSETNRRLESWKEIADYLGRDVRTVIRWEQERGLPVHRSSEANRQAVFAFVEEIDAWLRGSSEPIAAESAPTRRTATGSSGQESTRGTPSRRVRVAAASLLLLTLLALAAYRSALLTKRAAPEVATPDSIPAEFSVPMHGGAISFVRREMAAAKDDQVYFVRAVDLNGDGIQDLVLTSYSSGTVQTLFGAGDGTFHSQRSYGGCPQADQLVVADFDGDKISDVAATCLEGNSVVLLHGAGNGTFGRRMELSAPGGPRGITAADFDGDGATDLAVAVTTTRPGLLVFWNQRGSFKGARVLDADDIGRPTPADLDGDGLDDIAVTLLRKRRLSLSGLLSTRGRTFVATPPLPAEESSSANLGWAILAADFDRDGRTDLAHAAWGGPFTLFQGLGAGKFRSMQSFAIPVGGLLSVAHDLNGDGFLDVVFANSLGGSISFLAGRPDGTFAPPIEIGVGRYPLGLAVADVNNDRLPDLVVALARDNKLVVLLQERPENHPSK